MPTFTIDLHPDDQLGRVFQGPQSFTDQGFDLHLYDLPQDCRAPVLDLIAAHAIEARTICGQTFVRTSDLVHFTSGDDDWLP